MKLAIYGTNGAGKEALLIALAMNRKEATWDEIVFIDDTKENGLFHGYSRMQFEAFVQKYKPADILVHIAVGEPRVKRLLAEKVIKKEFELATLIHPTVEIGDNVVIGKDVRIKKQTYIGSNTVIEDSVTIQSSCNIMAGVYLKEGCMISTKVIIGENAYIGENVFIGMHSIIREHLKVDDFSIISMGAVVFSDIQSGVVAAGNPARIISKNVTGVFKKKKE